jgi:hypothetical protein
MVDKKIDDKNMGTGVYDVSDIFCHQIFSSLFSAWSENCSVLALDGRSVAARRLGDGATVLQSVDGRRA